MSNTNSEQQKRLIADPAQFDASLTQLNEQFSAPAQERPPTAPGEPNMMAPEFRVVRASPEEREDMEKRAAAQRAQGRLLANQSTNLHNLKIKTERGLAQLQGQIVDSSEALACGIGDGFLRQEQVLTSVFQLLIEVRDEQEGFASRLVQMEEEMRELKAFMKADADWRAVEAA